MLSLVLLLTPAVNGLPIDVVATAEKVDDELGVVDDEAEDAEEAEEDEERTMEDDDEMTILEEEEEEEDVTIADGDINDIDDKEDVDGDRMSAPLRFPLSLLEATVASVTV
jgi:hypothetical protein